MDTDDNNILRAAFFGPWVPQSGSTNRTRHLYPSLAHWYESAKFMPARPDLRDAILFCPTLKEVRKFAKKHQSLWRNDWNLIRHSVLIAGLGFLDLDRPDLGLRERDMSSVADALDAMQIPRRFLAACLERFHQWASGPVIGTYGANTAPESVVGKKMSRIVQANPSWTLVSLCNSKTAWRLHDWALAQYVPVRYIGTPQSRTTSSLIDDLIETSQQMIIFEVRGGKNSDGVIQKTKALKRVCTLELYRKEDFPTDAL